MQKAVLTVLTSDPYSNIVESHLTRRCMDQFVIDLTTDEYTEHYLDQGKWELLIKKLKKQAEDKELLTAILMCPATTATTAHRNESIYDDKELCAETYTQARKGTLIWLRMLELSCVLTDALVPFMIMLPVQDLHTRIHHRAV